MNDFEGFNDREDGYSAYIAGAHDKSASIQYNIRTNVIYFIPPNIPSFEKYVLDSYEIIDLAFQMIQLLKLKETLKFGKD